MTSRIPEEVDNLLNIFNQTVGFWKDASEDQKAELEKATRKLLEKAHHRKKTLMNHG